ncbi:MAG: glycerol kinase GlpK [Candidatus Symbiobacter sp.]|nr:glycerol kinase GlpK [Candidatus Symbiobacter sp.]
MTHPKNFILAIDQGTTSSRAMVFDQDLRKISQSQQEFRQYFPQSGWVEHDPEEIFSSCLAVMRTALAEAHLTARDIAALGITNQRETTVIWDRATGKAIHPAIVWQDRRTSERCSQLAAAGHGQMVTAKTGLILDAYFSATKIAWILDHVPGARAAAERGDLAFGTVDCFLLWRLTGGAVHATDATNAARTMLYDLGRGEWDEDLLSLLRVPPAILPEIRDSAADFGTSLPHFLAGAIKIGGMAGDQHAALIGQACFAPGMMKSTYGTGCFALMNIGDHPILSRHRLLTTVAYQLGGKRSYALEGSIFIAGAAVQWLRDGLGVIKQASDSGAMAAQSDPTQQLYLVPAFVGLGAPYWDSEARGAIFGLTRNSGPKELARAALEAVCFQTHDLLRAMREDWPHRQDSTTILRVDGGMTSSDWTMQRLADILGGTVDRPLEQETTAMGAAYLAGLTAGLCPPPTEFAKNWRLERRFSPGLAATDRTRLIAGWHDAVGRTLVRK